VSGRIWQSFVSVPKAPSGPGITGAASPTHVEELVMKAKVVEDADVVTYVVVWDHSGPLR